MFPFINKMDLLIISGCYSMIQKSSLLPLMSFRLVEFELSLCFAQVTTA